MCFHFKMLLFLFMYILYMFFNHFSSCCLVWQQLKFIITVQLFKEINNSKEGFCFDFNLFDNCIMNGFDTITKVGGYIILFSILFALGKQLPLMWFLPTLEISCGVSYITSLGIPLATVYPYVLALTSFGGFCAIAQTNSMIQESQLSILPYIIQKLITALVTSLLAIVYIQFIHQ